MLWRFATITWSASSPIITPTGEVSRPVYGRADVPLTLTATIAKGASTLTELAAAVTTVTGKERAPATV